MGLNGPLDVRDRADHGPRGNHRLEPSDRRPQTVTLTGGSAAAPQESDSGAFPRCSRPSLPPSLPPSLTHSFPPPSLHPLPTSLALPRTPPHAPVHVALSPEIVKVRQEIAAWLDKVLAEP